MLSHEFEFVVSKELAKNDGAVIVSALAKIYSGSDAAGRNARRFFNVATCYACANRPISARSGQYRLGSPAKDHMRITGWPLHADSDGATLPVNLADVDFHGTPQELRKIANFLLGAAAKLEVATQSDVALNVGIDLDNSNPHLEVGLWVNVIRHMEKS